MTDQTHYTTREVAMATGLSIHMVSYRKKALGIDGAITYEDVKAIMNFKTRKHSARQKAVNQLKLKLKNDGYATT